MDAFKWLYVIDIYARVGLTQLYSMLVLFTERWESKLLIQVRVEKLNEIYINHPE